MGPKFGFIFVFTHLVLKHRKSKPIIDKAGLSLASLNDILPTVPVQIFKDGSDIIAVVLGIPLFIHQQCCCC